MKVNLFLNELKSVNEELEEVTERVSSLHDMTFSLGDKLQIKLDDDVEDEENETI